MTEKKPLAEKKPRPKTGEKRATNQPFKIDRLPSSVHDAILYLHNERGKSWEQIEALSAEPYVEDWAAKGGGFIDWPALPFAVLELFPDMRLAHTTLHRWHDVRIAQVQRDVHRLSVQARSLAKSFAKSDVLGSDEAVINATRDIFMGVLSQDATTAGRIGVAKGLTRLGVLMQKARTNDLNERKVSVEERRIAQLEKDAELKRTKFQREMDAAETKVKKGEPLTVDDINQIRQRVFGMGPAPVAASA